MSGMLIREAETETIRFANASTMRLLAEELGETVTLSAHRSLLRAGARGAEPHHHEHTTHLLFVVSGSLDIMLGDDRARLHAGDLAFIPPRVTHAFRAAPGADADVLDVVTPGRSFDMFRHLAGSPKRTADDDTADTYADDARAWTAPDMIASRA